jgi:hypothetical protein
LASRRQVRSRWKEDAPVVEALVITALIVSCVAMAVVSWLVRIVARLAGLPLGAANWFLHGLGFLVTLPFVLTLLVLSNGLAPETWWAAGFVVLAAMVSFLGGGIQLVRDLAFGHVRRAHARGTR